MIYKLQIKHYAILSLTEICQQWVGSLFSFWNKIVRNFKLRRFYFFKHSAFRNWSIWFHLTINCSYLSILKYQEKVIKQNLYSYLEDRRPWNSALDWNFHFELGLKVSNWCHTWVSIRRQFSQEAKSHVWRAF